jgi:hypothetical protein
MAFGPLAGKRSVFVRERRTALDFAQVLFHRSMPRRNTHGPHGLYEAFEPSEARQICERIEWHFTPRHGSWLNMAEIELSVLAHQCLSDRMESKQRLMESVAAWDVRRDAASVRVDWQYTSADARVKLKRLYPEILSS